MSRSRPQKCTTNKTKASIDYSHLAEASIGAMKTEGRESVRRSKSVKVKVKLLWADEVKVVKEDDENKGNEDEVCV